MSNQHSIGQLQWRCRRGTKELDGVLSGFLEQDYVQASDDTQNAFVALLECQDPDIYDWLMGGKEPDTAELRAIIRVLRQKYSLI